MSVANIELIRGLIEAEPRQSLRMLAEETGLTKDAVHRILVGKLEKGKVCSVWVPHVLSDDNKADRMTGCSTHH